jgi:Carbamoyltransferase C-terminus
MVLNTSFNLKNQPIVESPEDAVKSLLASEGRISALFMGLFEVTLRPFPFSDLQKLAAESGMKTQGGAGEAGLSALLAAELGVVVRAKRFYMLEMVSSSGTGAASGAGTPLRIRIQGTNTVITVT